MSATLSDDVRSIKRLMLHNPVIIKLEETSLPDTTQLTQYHIKYVRSKYMHFYSRVLYSTPDVIYCKRNVDRSARIAVILNVSGFFSDILSNESLYPHSAFSTNMHYSMICLTKCEFIRPES